METDQIKKQDAKINKNEPLNGGWGWMVVLGAALINLLNQSMFANFGLIFGEKLKDLADGHATGITIVMAFNVVISNFSGLLVSPLLQKVSIRTINYIGISLTGSGLIFCSFSTTVWHICLGYSFMTGMGLGLLASTTFLAINDYFTTKKSTAVGLAMAGTGVGQMTMPTLIGVLLKKYEFSGTTRILGCMSFSGIIGALLFKPLFCCKKCDKDEVKIPENEEGTLLNVDKKNGEMIRNSRDAHYTDSAVEIAKSQQTLDNKEKTVCEKIVHSLGLNLLKDLIYVHIVIGLGFGYVSAVSFGAFFPMFLQDEAQLTLMQTTSCMTALSFADVIGRVTNPEITRRLNLSSRVSFMYGCLFLAMCRSCLVEMEQFRFIIIVSFLTGYARSLTIINQNLSISEYIANDQLPSAVGLNMMTKAVLTLTFGQSLGLLKDRFSYALCIHLLNVILIIVVCCYLLERCVKHFMSKKKTNNNNNNVIC